MATQLKKYSIEYHCDNCNYFFKHELLVGQRAPDTIMCQRCGVLAAKKSWTNPNPWPRPTPPVVPDDISPWWPTPRPLPRPRPRPWTEPWYPPNRPFRKEPPIIWSRRVSDIP